MKPQFAAKINQPKVQIDEDQAETLYTIMSNEDDDYIRLSKQISKEDLKRTY